MPAHSPQIVDQQEFIPVLDYDFTGDSYTVEKKRAFIEHLRRESTVFHAAGFAGISRKTAYNWYASDPAFAQAWEDSIQDATDVMEHSVYHQALNGDSLLKMFWLKKHRPEYRDRVTIDVQAVHEEIEQRVQQLGLRETPTMEEILRFSPDPDDLQKEAAAQDQER